MCHFQEKQLRLGVTFKVAYVIYFDMPVAFLFGKVLGSRLMYVSDKSNTCCSQLSLSIPLVHFSGGRSTSRLIRNLNFISSDSKRKIIAQNEASFGRQSTDARLTFNQKKEKRKIKHKEQRRRGKI